MHFVSVAPVFERNACRVCHIVTYEEGRIELLIWVGITVEWKNTNSWNVWRGRRGVHYYYCV